MAQGSSRGRGRVRLEGEEGSRSLDGREEQAQVRVAAGICGRPEMQRAADAFLATVVAGTTASLATCKLAGLELVREAWLRRLRGQRAPDVGGDR